MWYVWSFYPDMGWQELGCFTTDKQAREYLKTIRGSGIPEISVQQYAIYSMSNNGLIVYGTNDMLKRLFNLDNK